VNLTDLQKLVRQGEGQHLEFKRKANHPEKIIREVVAFANSGGGTLLIGVDDDSSVYGVKFPDEVEYERIRINSKRAVLAYHIQAGEQLPFSVVFKEEEKLKRTVYVRVADMTVRATWEMLQVLKQTHKEQGIQFEYGEDERKLIKFAEATDQFRMQDVRQQLRMGRKRASRLLITLVCAGVLSIHPTKDGDIFKRVLEG